MYKLLSAREAILNHYQGTFVVHAGTRRISAAEDSDVEHAFDSTFDQGEACDCPQTLRRDLWCGNTRARWGHD